MLEDTKKINKKLGRERGAFPEKGPEVEIPEVERKKEIEIPKVEKRAEIEIPEEKVAPTPPVLPSEEEVKEQAKKIKTLDKEHQVKVLIDLAFQKGLLFAIKVARSLDNDYVLDEFHSMLVDKLYEELVGKGKLKKL